MQDEKLVWTQINIKLSEKERKEIDKVILKSGIKKYHWYLQAIKTYMLQQQ